MSRKSFTLIEMLVVIAIIGILAGIILPSLAGARVAAARSKCVESKKQLILAAQQYASLNNDMMVFKFVAKGTPKPYSWPLRGYTAFQDKRKESGEPVIPKGRQYMAFSDMACNQAEPKDQEDGFTEEEVSGMLYAKNFLDKEIRNSNNLKMSYRFGKFYNENGNAIAYNMAKMKDTSNLLIFADVFKTGGKTDTYWQFDQTGISGAYVSTIHGGRAVVAFADGRANTLSADELNSSACQISKTIDANFSVVSK